MKESLTNAQPNAYLVYFDETAQANLRRIVNPRRGPNLSVPNLELKAGVTLSDYMMRKNDLGDFTNCITAEMSSRPVPHVFKRAETVALTELYKIWAPYIFAKVFRELKAPVQTYNKVSRLGWPEFTNPENKQDVLSSFFSQIAADGVQNYTKAFIILNVRLQAEPKKKKRTFMFVDSLGRSYEKEVSEEDRLVKVKDVGTRVSSRTRVIFNMPLPNLFKQVLDTAIHNVFLRYPAFHHDMFNKRLLPVKGKHICLDVKHFERFTADAVRARGAMLGGLYADINGIFERIPFVCPTDDWTKFMYLYPNREAGYSDQFSSGDSAVAPAQKEVFTALYAEYFHVTRRLARSEAVNLVFQGGDEKLTIRNYGDDNSISGDASELAAVFRFLQEYLHVEEEQPPKFLGFVWTEALGWRLPIDSYLLKTYLNERRPYSNFRKYPNLGWVEKRKIFSSLGHPALAERIFGEEDKALRTWGLPWTDIMWRAEVERRKAAAGELNPNFVLGKDYAMTAEEKLATGEFIGLTPDRTRTMIKQLADAKWLTETNL
jgi:hypothetical protein